MRICYKHDRPTFLNFTVSTELINQISRAFNVSIEKAREVQLLRSAEHARPKRKTTMVQFRMKDVFFWKSIIK